MRLLSGEFSREFGIMSYDYHITRADSWPESELNPISRSEWEIVATAHPELVELGAIGWLDIGEQKLFGVPGKEASFSWRLGRVDFTGEYDQTFGRLAAELAESLNARVLGDDE